MFACPNFIKKYLKSRRIAYTQYLLPGTSRSHQHWGGGGGGGVVMF